MNNKYYNLITNNSISIEYGVFSSSGLQPIYQTLTAIRPTLPSAFSS